MISADCPLVKLWLSNILLMNKYIHFVAHILLVFVHTCTVQFGSRASVVHIWVNIFGLKQINTTTYIDDNADFRYVCSDDDDAYSMRK